MERPLTETREVLKVKLTKKHICFKVWGSFEDGLLGKKVHLKILGSF